MSIYKFTCAEYYRASESTVIVKHILAIAQFRFYAVYIILTELKVSLTGTDVVTSAQNTFHN